jgi:S-DNA-T family DNA segregation ATPase FtsK/SpoIIIE
MDPFNPMSRTFARFERIPLLPEQWTGWKDALGLTFRRLAVRLSGLALMIAAIGCAIALLTYDANDPSLNNASPAGIQNALGVWGATIADLLVQSIGVASILAIVPPLLWGIWLVDGRIGLKLPSRTFGWVLSVIALATFAGLIPVQLFSEQPVASGGAIGEALFRTIASGIGAIGIPTPEVFAGMLPGIMGAMLMAWAIGLNPFQVSIPEWHLSSIRDVLSGIAHRITAALAGRLARTEVEFERVEPRMPRATQGNAITIVEAPAPAVVQTYTGTRISVPAARKPTSTALAVTKRGARFETDSDYELPDLDLLKEAKRPQGRGEPAEVLEENARALEVVLADFGVRGQIIEVLPGPVVTLYEFEPAAGVKGSRIISLAEDIARSMRAVSARVAVVPGKNAIGIELPTQRREMVQLRELLSSPDYDNPELDLALAFGKNIGGEPVIGDLTRMPHLLVAGTTGSGKSVAINTMILSLLYRLSPDQCKMIMIDPKEVELSAYDGIPHLLTPVVTDPKKAIVALKWTVREMEGRNKRLKELRVRNIKSYNERISAAKAKGEILKRTVATGYDSQTAEPLFEEVPLPMEHMPYIVVIIDEMADLMMVAGKDIEAAVQRLAQMGRASGIHIITATQRPSVDVITGTIKANFPTRISFRVTSKIDSRTILGEQGAEQLLGQGDMLLMEGGGRVRRVHGPFVSDLEVEEVVKYLRTQGEPVYIEDITQEPEEPENGQPSEMEGEGSGDDLYDQAVAIVARDRRATTSYIQRRLQIGYNRAARIIEKMEEEGVISAPNHAGKRDVLVGDHSGRGG